MFCPLPSPALVAGLLRHLPPLPTVTVETAGPQAADSAAAAAVAAATVVAVDETRAYPRRLVGALQLARAGAVLAAVDALLAPDAETNLARVWIHAHRQAAARESQAAEAGSQAAACGRYPVWLEADARTLVGTVAGALAQLRQGGVVALTVATVSTPLHVSVLYLLHRLCARTTLVPAAGAASAGGGLAGQGVLCVARELRERAPEWAIAPLKAVEAAAAKAAADAAADAAAAAADTAAAEETGDTAAASAIAARAHAAAALAAAGGSVSVVGTWLVPADVILADAGFMAALSKVAGDAARAERRALYALGREYLTRAQDYAVDAMADTAAQRLRAQKTERLAAAGGDVRAPVELTKDESERIKGEAFGRGAVYVRLPVRQVGLEYSVAAECISAWNAAGVQDLPERK
jgi:hypothetical protein